MWVASESTRSTPSQSELILIVRTDAIVLKRMDYRETSQIITLFTRKLGKISVLAKGSRSAKSRFGATLQPLSFIEAVFYHKSTRQLQTLSETSFVDRFATISRDLDKISVGMQAAELLSSVLEEDTEHPESFRLMLELLSLLDAADKNAANLLPYFHLQLAERLGFQPHIHKEDVEALEDKGGLLILDSGEIHPGFSQDRASGSIRGSRSALRAFAISARAKPGVLLRMEIPVAIQQELVGLTESYLRYHIEGLRPSRSADVFAQMNGR